ncbi:cytochrome c-type biogenesis protein CcmH precursor [mine drainage metagenome]|uniref:Cytochrome c-type biogenesis protein CcmH n=1 Tax=mine drainage metagenome TaxID=410659 RepID=A0A1J5RTN8_9ZZZZ
MKTVMAFMLMLLVSGTLLAREAAPLAADVAVEKRMVAITSVMRCLVCQNESLAASQADLAVDLRREIREMIKQGKSDKQIRDFMVNRYGDFVLYRPPMMASTYLLWFGPFLLLAFGLVALVIYLRRRGAQLDEQDLSAAEIRRAEELLKQQEAGR